MGNAKAKSKPAKPAPPAWNILNWDEYMSFDQYRAKRQAVPDLGPVKPERRKRRKEGAELDPAEMHRVRQLEYTRYREDVEKLLNAFELQHFEGSDDYGNADLVKARLRDVFARNLPAPLNFGPVEFSVKLVIEALEFEASDKLHLLQLLAAQGHDSALHSMAKVVIPAVRLINEKARAKPERMLDSPQQFPYWPVLKSEHRDFNDDHETLLKCLQVGKRFPGVVDKGARWTSKDVLGRWATHLCQYIEILCDTGANSYGRKYKPWERTLLKLKPFSAKTWREWWEVAQGVLIDEFIDVHEIPELNEVVKSPADRKSPGRIRKRILQGLRNKFKSMAGENKL